VPQAGLKSEVIEIGTTRSLPRGPHSLSAEEVSASQRERVIAGVIEEVAEKG
jgi:hypothetical protein